jgi:hypothetical protein
LITALESPEPDIAVDGLSVVVWRSFVVAASWTCVLLLEAPRLVEAAVGIEVHMADRRQNSAFKNVRVDDAAKWQKFSSSSQEITERVLNKLRVAFVKSSAEVNANKKWLGWI